MKIQIFRAAAAWPPLSAVRRGPPIHQRNTNRRTSSRPIRRPAHLSAQDRSRRPRQLRPHRRNARLQPRCPGREARRTGRGLHGPQPGRRSRASQGSRPTTPLQPSMSPGDLLINFELGSANVTPQARSNAKAFAEALNSPELSSHRFLVNGHTDATGSVQTNTILAQARAEAVKSFLVAQGVNAKRSEAKGYGSTQRNQADALHPKAVRELPRGGPAPGLSGLRHGLAEIRARPCARALDAGILLEELHLVLRAPGRSRTRGWRLSMRPRGPPKLGGAWPGRDRLRGAAILGGRALGGVLSGLDRSRRCRALGRGARPGGLLSLCLPATAAGRPCRGAGRGPRVLGARERRALVAIPVGLAIGGAGISRSPWRSPPAFGADRSRDGRSSPRSPEGR